MIKRTDAKAGEPDLQGLPRSFFERDPRTVAPELLGKILARDDGRSGRIIEVEAYCGAEDPAAHTFRGPTSRNRTMFGPAGHLYVYFTYGMHWCCNTVCGPEGQGWGVLVRAIRPIAGIELMRKARPLAHSDRDLASGPARLTQALGIDGSFDGADIVLDDRGVSVRTDGTPPPTRPQVGPRIGVSRAKNFPWRWRSPQLPG
ncbi:MAG: DNA-3-methyladenine glycosylase [Rhodanobacteraceae bacterium]